jgi:PadR family transcriptional regulator PadR
MAWSALWFTWMSSEVELLQGALDLILLRALEAMGPQHAYSLAARLERVSKSRLTLKQGTLYPALVRLEQNGWIKGSWRRTENNREAKYYSITKAGTRALAKETERWRRLAGFVDALLLNEP